MKNSVTWRVCCMIAILVTLLSFSPLALPSGKIAPKLGPLPYVLWVGILNTIVLVVLTFIGFRVHPGHKEGGSK